MDSARKSIRSSLGWISETLGVGGGEHCPDTTTRCDNGVGEDALRRNAKETDESESSGDEGVCNGGEDAESWGLSKQMGTKDEPATGGVSYLSEARTLG